MQYDELRAELNDIPEDDLDEPNNPELEYVLEKFDCDELLPLAQRIIWLAAVKEACGNIPDWIPIDYEEVKLLVTLHDEENKMMQFKNYEQKKQMEQQQDEARSKSGGSSVSGKNTNVGLGGAILS
jgi:hypothetical protein